MSFSYMFKFIIIGDTGTNSKMKVLANHVCFYSSLINVSDRNIKSPSESSLVPK
jgi:hypothetical protein